MRKFINNQQKSVHFDGVPYAVHYNQLPIVIPTNCKPINQEEYNREDQYAEPHFVPPVWSQKNEQPVEQTPAPEYYYDDYISDRVFCKRSVESNYDNSVIEDADLLRRNNEMIMDELDSLRRTEMATLMEYFTQLNLLVMQTCKDDIAELKRMLIKNNN